MDILVRESVDVLTVTADAAADPCWQRVAHTDGSTESSPTFRPSLYSGFSIITCHRYKATPEAMSTSPTSPVMPLGRTARAGMSC